METLQSKFHNPSNLPLPDAGSGWRFLLESELHSKLPAGNLEFWMPDSNPRWVASVSVNCRDIDLRSTYRTSGPLPDLLKNGNDRRREILGAVEQCVCKERQSTYGDAEDNFADIAALMSIVFRGKITAPFTASDAALAAICIKLARTAKNPQHLDNWVDGAGYFVCGGGIMKNIS